MTTTRQKRRKSKPGVEHLPDEDMPILLTAKPKESNRRVDWEDLHGGRMPEHLSNYTTAYYGPPASLE